MNKIETQVHLKFLQEINSTINTTNSNNSTNMMKDEHVWGAAVATSIGFLLLSFILTFFIVLCSIKKVNKTCLRWLNMSLISLAVGSLVGDAIIHIIPDILGAYNHEKEEESDEGKPDVRITSTMILVGFLSFFILEKIFLMTGCGHAHGEEEPDFPDGDDHADHSHNVNGDKKVEYENVNRQTEVVVENNEGANPREGENCETIQVKVLEIEIKKEDSNPIPRVDSNSETQVSIPTKEGMFSFKNKKPSAALIIISDGIHNVMDGIALGMTFASKNVTLIITTNIAVLLHEIPKELGDAGILLNAGFINKSVLFWNVANNVTCIFGTLIGLGLGTISKSSEAYCMGFVAGNFLYIALSEMIPEIVKKKTLMQTLTQIFFIMLGFGIMYIVLLIE